MERVSDLVGLLEAAFPGKHAFTSLISNHQGELGRRGFCPQTAGSWWSACASEKVKCRLAVFFPTDGAAMPLKAEHMLGGEI